MTAPRNDKLLNKIKANQKGLRKDKLLDQVRSPTWRLNYVRHRVTVLDPELDEGLILTFMGQPRSPARHGQSTLATSPTPRGNYAT